VRLARTGGRLLDPLAEAIRRHVFAGDKIHGDDTTVPVLRPGLGRTATARLWIYVRDDRPFCGDAAPAAAHFYSPDRDGAHPRARAHLANFTGFLQAEAYAGFAALYDEARTRREPITEAACWAHCRREFFDHWEHPKSPVAREALDRIAAIYAIEAKAAFAPADERVAHRRDAAVLIEAFFVWAEATCAKLSAKSALAAAFRYTINRRQPLTRFSSDGRLEIDNNIAENGMRPVALGRKNYLFAGSDAGGDQAASIYALVQTARLNGLNPEAYLKDPNTHRRPNPASSTAPTISVKPDHHIRRTWCQRAPTLPWPSKLRPRRRQDPYAWPVLASASSGSPQPAQTAGKWSMMASGLARRSSVRPL
jgi:hypothetical protein